MKKYNNLFFFLAFLTPFTFGVSCKIAPRGDQENADALTPMVQATGWDEVRYTVRGSEITLQRTGHFYVEPNACFRKESGTLELATWNRIAQIINQAWLAPRTQTPLCVALPPEMPPLRAGVEFKDRSGNALSFVEQQGSKACAPIENEMILTPFLEALSEAAQIARQEGC
jgi:hypothetical protein